MKGLGTVLEKLENTHRQKEREIERVTVREGERESVCVSCSVIERRRGLEDTHR